jgi:Putative transcriptional regulator
LNLVKKYLYWLMIEPKAGRLLVANPHLDDPNFLRSVIFLCEHNEEGSFGFVLNRKLDYTVDELVPELGDFQLPVYEGGPVELHTLHFLHQYPEQIPGGQEVMEGVYWGGEFEKLIELINSRTIDTDKIRFYLGYSGWGAGQLASEMDENTWIVSEASKKFLFASNEKELWKAVLKELGGTYELFINAPVDPRLN